MVGLHFDLIFLGNTSATTTLIPYSLIVIYCLLAMPFLKRNFSAWARVVSSVPKKSCMSEDSPSSSGSGNPPKMSTPSPTKTPVNHLFSLLLHLLQEVKSLPRHVLHLLQQMKRRHQ